MTGPSKLAVNFFRGPLERRPHSGRPLGRCGNSASRTCSSLFNQSDVLSWPEGAGAPCTVQLVRLHRATHRAAAEGACRGPESNPGIQPSPPSPEEIKATSTRSARSSTLGVWGPPRWFAGRCRTPWRAHAHQKPTRSPPQREAERRCRVYAAERSLSFILVWPKMNGKKKKTLTKRTDFTCAAANAFEF
ncbi:hypothetical protein BC828DRAFT_303200 [Blastocladiella britannica]|nr:hypothetical protein BC828DRAFT_303200 [Blastocladiella britannica]